eukprot:scaffold30339_cov32-Tisochrysis_lutea.AAC.1
MAVCIGVTQRASLIIVETSETAKRLDDSAQSSRPMRRPCGLPRVFLQPLRHEQVKAHCEANGKKKMESSAKDTETL